MCECVYAQLPEHDVCKAHSFMKISDIFPVEWFYQKTEKAKKRKRIEIAINLLTIWVFEIIFAGE